MDMELVNTQLKTKMNATYSCEQFFKHILTQTYLLKQIQKNVKYEQ